MCVTFQDYLFPFLRPHRIPGRSLGGRVTRRLATTTATASATATSAWRSTGWGRRLALRRGLSVEILFEVWHVFFSLEVIFVTLVVVTEVIAIVIARWSTTT